MATFTLPLLQRASGYYKNIKAEQSPAGKQQQSWSETERADYYDHLVTWPAENITHANLLLRMKIVHAE